MPRYTEDYSPFRALLGAPYPLPVYIARRVYPRQAPPPSQSHQQAIPPPPPQYPPPHYGPQPTNDPVAIAAQAHGFPYDPNWRLRPPATDPIPYPQLTPEQEAQRVSRNVIRVELKRLRRIAHVAARSGAIEGGERARAVVDAMAPVRNMQAVQRMQNMLNIPSPAQAYPPATAGPSASDHPYHTASSSPPDQPADLQHAATLAASASSRRMLHPAAVLVPRAPDLSDLTSYYPPPDPVPESLNSATGFKHWSNERLGAGSPFRTPKRERAGSHGSHDSLSSPQSNHLATPHADGTDPSRIQDPSHLPSPQNDQSASLYPDGDTPLDLSSAESEAIKAMAALVNSEIEQTETETIIRIPRSYHTRARMIAESCGAAPNAIPTTSSTIAPGSASAASALLDSASPATPAAHPRDAAPTHTSGLRSAPAPTMQGFGNAFRNRMRFGSDPNSNSYVAEIDDTTLVITPATNRRLREVLGLQPLVDSSGPVEAPKYSPMAIDPRTGDAMGSSGSVSANGTGARLVFNNPFDAVRDGATITPASQDQWNQEDQSQQPQHPQPAFPPVSWPRPLPARETGTYDPHPRPRTPHPAPAPSIPSDLSHLSDLANLPQPRTSSAILSRPIFSPPTGLSRGLTLPSAPASRPPPFMPAAKACHNALLALRIVEWQKGNVRDHNVRLLSSALREGRRLAFGREDQRGFTVEEVREALDARSAGRGVMSGLQGGEGAGGTGEMGMMEVNSAGPSGIAGGGAGPSSLVQQYFEAVQIGQPGHLGTSLTPSHENQQQIDEPMEDAVPSLHLAHPGTLLSASPAQTGQSENDTPRPNKRQRRASPLRQTSLAGTTAPRSVAEIMRGHVAGDGSMGPSPSGMDDVDGVDEVDEVEDVRPALKRLRPRNRR